MAKIRVTRGGCGIAYTDANGVARHACKTPESGPFECDSAQAERLVRLGVAEYVTAAKPTPEKPAADAATPEQAAESTQEPGEIKGHLDAADLETWDYNELKKLAADLGVESKSKKKADLIAAIVAVEVEADAEDPDELPELGAADPE
ncbi:MAG: Rho termination factor N-terminal domain-containing protein [Lachnospiraceae bacterium]|nr:Rho termination factor N-terminal domain-containing protein [Lachnospiraceae bacterium]